MITLFHVSCKSLETLPPRPDSVLVRNLPTLSFTRKILLVHSVTRSEYCLSSRLTDRKRRTAFTTSCTCSSRTVRPLFSLFKLFSRFLTSFNCHSCSRKPKALIPGIRSEQDLFVRLIDSATKQVRSHLRLVFLLFLTLTTINLKCFRHLSAPQSPHLCLIIFARR